MKTIIIIVLNLVALSAFANPDSALVCDNSYGEAVAIPFDYENGNTGAFSIDIYDDCFYQEGLLAEAPILDTFLVNLKNAVSDDENFMLICLSHSSGGSNFIYAYETQAGEVQSKSGFLNIEDSSVVINGTPNCRVK